MNNLPRIVIALFRISSLLDIAEKIKNWGDDKDKKEDKKKEDEPSGMYPQRKSNATNIIGSLLLCVA